MAKEKAIVRSLHERVATAAQYYRVTDRSFRALCPEASGHMNMGLWPAGTLRRAQEALIDLALERSALVWRDGERGAGPRGILDLGSGWGGSRALVHRRFPKTPYYGVNVSREQVDAARLATADIPLTSYLEAPVEEFDRLPWGKVDLMMSFEAAFHFEDKAALIKEAARQGVRAATLLEICVEDAGILSDPLLFPSLRNAWSIKQYETAFVASGFGRPRVEDLSGRVFDGFLHCLEALDMSAYRGRRAIVDQVRRATEVLACAAERGQVSYVLLVAMEE